MALPLRRALSASHPESAPKTLAAFWYCLGFHRASTLSHSPRPCSVPFRSPIQSGRQLSWLLSHNCRLQARTLIFGCFAAVSFFYPIRLCFGFQFVKFLWLRSSVRGIRCVFICLLSLSQRQHHQHHRRRRRLRFVWQFSAWHSRF